MLETSMVITAIGQRPDVSFKDSSRHLNDMNLTRWNTIDTNEETCQSSVPYIFSAGDAQTGPQLVVTAIGGGRRSARSIHQYLSGEPVAEPPKSLYNKHIQESLFESVDGVVKKQRSQMTELSVEERITSFIEVDQVLTEEEAMKEADRCLDCCRLCYNKDTA